MPVHQNIHSNLRRFFATLIMLAVLVVQFPGATLASSDLGSMHNIGPNAHSLADTANASQHGDSAIDCLFCDKENKGMTGDCDAHCAMACQSSSSAIGEPSGLICSAAHPKYGTGIPDTETSARLYAAVPPPRL